MQTVVRLSTAECVYVSNYEDKLLNVGGAVLYEADLFIGLASMWAQATRNIFTTASVLSAETPPLIDAKKPSIIVGWPVDKILPLPQLDWLVNTIQYYLHLGKRVEVGSKHSHGRVGVLLACLLLYYHDYMDETMAVRAMQARFCSYAIRSIPQYLLVKSYHALLTKRRAEIKELKEGGD